ncbi:hypothetical protein TL18_04295 [Methanobrevibacter sp. YE315]|uniref:diguanylate cyclase domain-containing protein n=1 Tax=Methanobrevibacter sp. YE315 TaxID=1609968 RepID=UPI000764F18E|nr:diguanylate cyclase [Methanobrevibacter sp. YE315]AMD17310.1 hypothetical protein TL18_04295 [Methanobrevibacter sp. YE315]
MEIKDKILVISDDDENKLVNQFEEILKDSEIEMISSRSDIDDLKMNMRRDFYVIFVDYDYLDTEVNRLVSLIRDYLRALPLIDVMSFDTSIFNREKIPHVSFFDKNSSFESLHNQLLNFIKIMKFNKSLNDVSHLPGNFVINEVMETKLRNKDDFVIMYLDIDKFKAFCDYFGIYRSGKVIEFLSSLCIKLVDEYGVPEDFIGHVGGDDMVLIFTDFENAKFIGNKIIEEFDAHIKDFYDKKDVEKGYIEVLNRKGIMEKFPFVTLSIVTISNEFKDYSTTDEIYRDMMVAKKEAKQTMGSILLHST